MSVSPTPVEAGHEATIHRAFGGGPPIVCFANDWHGDPTSKHHIMRAYAAHTDVLWIESSGMRRPQLSSPMDLRRLALRVRKAASGLRRQQAGLHVLSPLSVPLPGHAAVTAVNGWLYRRAVRAALATLGLRAAPLLWVYTPTVAPYLDGMPRVGLVYHCVDRWWAFADYDAQVMRECHAELCRAADVVFVSAAALREDCLPHSEKVILVPHGVDWQHFAQAALATASRPVDIADCEGPILGFFGLIHEWIDQRLLVRLAAAFPEATLVLIGRVQVDVSRLKRVPNIRLLGERPYQDLPAYAAAFDVGLVPFVLNDLTTAVNPIKLREYLSAGMPVVASALPEIEHLKGNSALRSARTPEEFIAAIRHFLSLGRDPQARRARALRMRSESWSGRCAEMAGLVRQHLRV